AGHLAGWRLRDERRALPRLEKDMQVPGGLPGS
ncbi:hypothetical protein AK812_SmicGene47683, partial [Symbiodinium microadriaticum]